MGQISSKLRSVAGGRLAYYCQGCDCTHQVKVQGSPAWGYNGNPDAPTFAPSVLVRSGHFVPGQEGKQCWCTYEERTGRSLPKGVGCSICHTLITDGRVQFLGDCTHALAGQTLDLPDLPERFSDANYHWGDTAA